MYELFRGITLEGAYCLVVGPSDWNVDRGFIFMALLRIANWAELPRVDFPVELQYGLRSDFLLVLSRVMADGFVLEDWDGGDNSQC